MQNAQILSTKQFTADLLQKHLPQAQTEGTHTSLPQEENNHKEKKPLAKMSMALPVPVGWTGHLATETGQCQVGWSDL